MFYPNLNIVVLFNLLLIIFNMSINVDTHLFYISVYIINLQNECLVSGKA